MDKRLGDCAGQKAEERLDCFLNCIAYLLAMRWIEDQKATTKNVAIDADTMRQRRTVRRRSSSPYK
jgi:hypothetical protein